jgi:hypothetical protein
MNRWERRFLDLGGRSVNGFKVSEGKYDRIPSLWEVYQPESSSNNSNLKLS